MSLFSSFVSFMVKRMGLDDLCDFDYGLDADEAVGKQGEDETSKREDDEQRDKSACSASAHACSLLRRDTKACGSEVQQGSREGSD